MNTAQRGADAAPRPRHPGDLYLDPMVPDAERVTLVREGWTAQASHVWTGSGWSRLVPGVVTPVPCAGPLPAGRSSGVHATGAPVGLTLVTGGRTDRGATPDERLRPIAV